MSAISPSLPTKLRAAIANGPPLRLMVMFGSQARGTAALASDVDVDVGIVPTDRSLTVAEELAFASALSAVTGTEVDLVRLDQVDPFLGCEVARSGVCVFEDEPGAFAAWRAAAISDWIDFDEVIAPHRERFLQRLAGRGAPQNGDGPP